jgi:DNA-binding protein YbaB
LSAGCRWFRFSSVTETDHLKAILAEAQDSASRLGGLDRTTTASDEAGVVTVTVRADGSVVRARLHDQWRSRLGAADLSALVAEAIRIAQEKVSQEWAENPEGGEPVTVDLTSAKAGHEDPVDFARELMALLDEVEARLPDLTGVAQQAVDREVRVGGPAGGITAVARQGVLVSLELDPQWIREAPRNRIEEELSAVLAQALPGLRRQATDAMREVAPVGKLLGLLDDPATLFARLGLVTGHESYESHRGAR